MKWEIQTLLFQIFTIPVVLCQWTSPKVCMQQTDPGTCFAKIPSFSYNPVSGKCDPFIYTGCGGNHNRFRKRSDCVKSCACHVPPKAGNCNTRPAWFYNPEKGCCERYASGGCPGNGNAFSTYQECKELCAGSTSGVVLPLGSNWGSSKTVAFDLKRRGKMLPHKLAISFGIPKTVWLHNENMDIKKMNPNVRHFMRIVTPAGKMQVPGVQTKAHWHAMSRGIPIGGSFSRRVTGGSMVPTMSGGSKMKSVSSFGGSGGSFGGIGSGAIPSTSGFSSGSATSFTGSGVGGGMMGSSGTGGVGTSMGSASGFGSSSGGFGATGIDDGFGSGGFGSGASGFGSSSGGFGVTGSVIGGDGSGGFGSAASGFGSNAGGFRSGGAGGFGTSSGGTGTMNLGGGGSGSMNMRGSGSQGLGMGSGSGISDVHFPGSSNDIIDAHSQARHPSPSGFSSTNSGGTGRMNLGGGGGGGGSGSMNMRRGGSLGVGMGSSGRSTGISDVHFPGSSNDIVDAHSQSRHPTAGMGMSSGSSSLGGSFGVGGGQGTAKMSGSPGGMGGGGSSFISRGSMMPRSGFSGGTGRGMSRFGTGGDMVSGSLGGMTG